MRRGRYLWPLAALAAVVAALAWAGGAWTFLTLGFVIGMAHALEADHLAAVGAMLNRGEGRRAMMLRGAVWGAGHTLALFAICSMVLALGLTITGRAEAMLELAVGAMIAGLGLRVLWKLRREHVHIHVHEHDGVRHFHAHSHACETGAHRVSAHAHRHAATLGVGLVHGAAGSAGLLVLTVAATDSLAQALAYFAVFGIGSLAGMAALTTAASVPLAMLERGATWMKTATALAIGGLAIWIGGALALSSALALAG